MMIMNYDDVLAEINKKRLLITQTIEEISDLKNTTIESIETEINDLKLRISNLKDLKKRISRA